MSTDTRTEPRTLPAGDPPTRAEAEAVFEKKYRQREWKGGLKDGTRSGFGSTVRSTERIREFLPEFLREYEIRTLVDAPCGDFHWMRRVALPPELTYIGGDIARSVIAELQAQYGSARFGFRYFDVTQSEFPAADAWLCRDCFIHLPLALCRAALENFARSELRYVLLTHYTNVTENQDIPVGRFSPRNLTLAPFHLPPPIRAWTDSPREPPRPERQLGVWTRDQIRRAIG